ncbi:MAG: hypothetical protein CMJ19_01175 [Phycisphaeraceae bacterium]|nr:hypothetical protein [Phycisphaeraceae bacterium]
MSTVVLAESSNIDMSDVQKDIVHLSSLSPDEENKALSLFDKARANWLDIRSGEAWYRVRKEKLETGRFLPQDGPVRVGMLSFAVELIDPKDGFTSPVKATVWMHDKRLKINLLVRDIFAVKSKTDVAIWSDDPSAKMVENAPLSPIVSGEPLFFPFDVMAKTYSDKRVSNKLTVTKSQFLSYRGVAWRSSSSEETRSIFAGEKQYLFRLSHGQSDANYWVSAVTGELRQIDLIIPGGTKTFRYECYSKVKGKGPSFPQRVAVTWKQGVGELATGWRQTIILRNVKLNGARVHGVFTIPATATMLQ